MTTITTEGVPTTVRPVTAARAEPLIRRFSFAEQLVHWAVAISFLVAGVTGAAFAYPRLFWITNFFGGGPTARLVHDWSGVIFVVGAVLMALMWARQMFLDAQDRKWLGALWAYINHRDDEVPPAGKYNGGQKLYFWFVLCVALAVIVTGIPLWFPAGYSAGTLRVLRLLHYLGGLLGGLGFLVHGYLTTISFPGTARGMAYGTVTRPWARLHHPRWYRDKVGE